jgi:hypothetical protein
MFATTYTRRNRSRRRVLRLRNRRPAFEMLEARHLLAVLSNAPGDGTVSITVDGLGAYGSAGGSTVGNANYDPIGPTPSAGTTYLSGVLLQIGGTRQWLASGGFSNSLTSPTTSTSNSDVISTFTFQGLKFDLVQSLSDLVDDSGGASAHRTGSLLTQTYRITNISASPISFDLFRYFDGDLRFDTSLIDGGGRLPFKNSEILFETDTATGSADEATFVGITAEGGVRPADNRYEISGFSSLKNKIGSGTPLTNSVTGDGSDVDQFVDAGAGYDLALALHNQFTLAPVASDSYVAQTIFGTGSPDIITKITSIEIAPSTADRSVNTMHTVTAIARDQDGNPFPGATIQFSVTGANLTSGQRISDSNGVATFSYSGANPGADTIVASAGIVSSQPAGVHWLANVNLNLDISNPTAPDIVRPGTSINVGWTVANSGPGTAAPAWTDAVYLSTDNVLDAGDIPLATGLQHSDQLSAGAHYDQLRSVTIPASVAIGKYFLLYSTDTGNSVAERNESDNVVARSIDVAPPGFVPPTNPDVQDSETPVQSTNATADPVNSGAGTTQLKQQLLLLTLPTPNVILPALPVLGAAGTVTTKKQVEASIGMPQVVDAAFGSDEIDKTALLTNFLDFVEPEALVVDLGDEPPAKISVDVSKAAAVEVMKPVDKPDKPANEPAIDPSHSGASTNLPGPAVTALEQPPDNKSAGPIKPVIDSSFSSSIANNWRLVATGGAIVLLVGAAWSSRSKWVQIARKLRWR